MTRHLHPVPPLLLFFLFWHTVSSAQVQNSDWENPEVFDINKLAPRAHFIPYQDESTALSFDAAQSEFFFSLNGEWDFAFFNNPDSVPDTIFGLDYPLAQFDKIPVPSNWQLQGYGMPYLCQFINALQNRSTSSSTCRQRNRRFTNELST